MSGARQRVAGLAMPLLPLLLAAASVEALAQSKKSPAADEREPIRIHYRAPGNCPDASAFLDSVLVRTPRARAAAPSELARVFQITVVARPGESFGEISVKRQADAKPVRLSAVGTCENVLNTLAQFAALSLDPALALLSAQEPDLPQNPYLNWSGPIAPPLPDNPYRNWGEALSPALPENPYRNRNAAMSREFPGKSHRPEPASEELPENPYRTR